MNIFKKSFHKILIFSFIISSILNIINCCVFKIELVPLSENQTLYIYSSLAQVIGALLGLTISGYGVMDSKRNTIAETDETVADYVNDIRPNHFRSLQYIIIFSISSIILCLLVIATYDNAYRILTPFFMTETMIVFTITMCELFRFIHFLNPKTIEKMGTNEKMSIDTEYINKDASTTVNVLAGFSPFITNYNILEKLIKDFACELIDSPSSAYKLQIFDSLSILLENGVIFPETYSIIDEFRRYRNALVHSSDSDKSVNPLIHQKLNTIYKLLKSIYDARKTKNDQEIQTNINKLKEYSKAHGYNEFDRKILDYLASHSYASLNEIAEDINYAIPSIRHRMVSLQKIGVVIKIGQGKQTKWQINPNFKSS